MSKLIRHSRTYTEYESKPSNMLTGRSNASAIRLNTFSGQTFTQSKQKFHRITKNLPCQQPHIITIKSVNAPKVCKTNKETIDQVGQYENTQNEKYTLQNPIAKGAFGMVYKAHTATRHHLAVKKIAIGEKINRELGILKKLDHPNLLKIIDHYFTVEQRQRYLHIVSQYYSHNLKTIIQQKSISNKLATLYLYQILQGLTYLKQREIMHRDLTPSNILVEKGSHRVVIADFGSAKTSSYDQPNNLSYVCARAYRAPQLIFGSVQYTSPIDMWGFACIAVELVTGRSLFRSQSTIEHMLQVLKLLGTPNQVEMAQINPDFSLKQFQMLPKFRKKGLKDAINSSNTSFIDLMSKILVYSPAKRMSPQSALEHPYFDSLRNHQFYEQNNLNPKDFDILSHKNEQILVSPLQIRLQVRHKRFATNYSKLSESTTWKSSVRREGSKFEVTVRDELDAARRLFS